MSSTAVSPKYLQIAQDIAGRISKGALAEGTRIYGRSIMASEYGVSPETIRRAMRLLLDMKVVDIKPQSGVVVLSADNARRYLQNFDESAEVRSLRKQLGELLEQYGEMNKRLSGLVNALMKSQSTFASAERPFPNYEIPIPADSPLIGKNIGTLQFWQSTGSTIVAIRRGQTVILSPGPYAELYDGDVIIIVGTPAAAEAASRFVTSNERAVSD